MFRKFAVTLAVVTTCFFMVGCYSVRMAAPGDGDVKIMSPAKSASFKSSQMNWFALWGLVSLTPDKTERIIRENKLTEVRTETKTTFIDAIISGIIFGIVGVNTTVIEGNR